MVQEILLDIAYRTATFLYRVGLNGLRLAQTQLVTRLMEKMVPRISTAKMEDAIRDKITAAIERLAHELSDTVAGFCGLGIEDASAEGETQLGLVLLVSQEHFAEAERSFPTNLSLNVDEIGEVRLPIRVETIGPMRLETRSRQRPAGPDR